MNARIQRSLAILALVPLATLSLAQDQKPSEPSLEDQIIELRATVAKLQAALGKNHRGTADEAAGTHDHTSHGKGGGGAMAMGKGKGMDGMKMDGMKMDGMKMDGMKMDGMKMDGMKMDGMKINGMKMDGMKMDGMKMGMAMMKQGMGMDHMSKMGKSPDASLEISALPGFPGASHIYHIGSTGFFLDHLEHLKLTTEQQQQLNGIKEKALAEQSEFDRQIEKAEEELWSLTSVAEPNTAAIQTKLAEIGTLTSQQRLSFISAVGMAAEVLSDDQRKALTGHESGKQDSPADAHQHQPNPDQ
tara:strand:- start:11828 stop:12733 length:906 start_codon:yes stop_codon:yes gene_type:complete